MPSWPEADVVSQWYIVRKKNEGLLNLSEHSNIPTHKPYPSISCLLPAKQFENFIVKRCSLTFLFKNTTKTPFKLAAFLFLIQCLLFPQSLILNCHFQAVFSAVGGKNPCNFEMVFKQNTRYTMIFKMVSKLHKSF